MATKTFFSMHYQELLDIQKSLLISQMLVRDRSILSKAARTGVNPLTGDRLYAENVAKDDTSTAITAAIKTAFAGIQHLKLTCSEELYKISLDHRLYNAEGGIDINQSNR